ncbi:transketolase family protein [Candidatus Wolfebacteria bacterium]|nr:transketolase family protein [Candidatus Wolfebacteria bacterium]
MLNTNAKLSEKVFDPENVKAGSTRDGFGHGVVEAGEKDKNVVVMCADLMESTRSHWFNEKFPDRYIEMGVAEQNLASVAAGISLVGKIPFIASYAAFSPGRNNEQIRTLISLKKANVKICGMHAGVSVGPDGATHQQLEDIALMRVQPNMIVLVPSDEEEARKAVIAAAEYEGPVYIRFGRTSTPEITTKDTPFEIGKAFRVWEGKDPVVGIIASGPFLHSALVAAKNLKEKGIESIVLNLHTIKPLDTKALLALSNEVGAIVTVEEHQIAGGMGSTVAEYLAQVKPMPMEFIGVKDRFGQSGNPAELIEHYGMGVSHIESAVRKALDRI